MANSSRSEVSSFPFHSSSSVLASAKTECVDSSTGSTPSIAQTKSKQKKAIVSFKNKKVVLFVVVKVESNLNFQNGVSIPPNKVS